MTHRIARDFALPLRLCRLSIPNHACWLLLALAVILARLALLPLIPAPEPKFHDEYSYLLASDTFARGALINPPLAHPEFFESPHVLVQPFYASKYPPGQGLVLAIGQKIGHPYWGVLLNGGLMIFLFCWAAGAWLPRHWALIAGILASLAFFGHYWLNSYWGGALAACGGALVTGALGYLLRGSLAPARFTLALGAALLFVSRPYEGGVFCVAALGILFWIFWRSPDKGRFVRAVIVPNTLLLIAVAALAGWYNWRITGNAREFPYMVYFRQYESNWVLGFMPPVPAHQYRTPNMRALYAWQDKNYKEFRSLSLPRALAMQASLFLLNGVVLQFAGCGLLLLALPWARLGRRKKWLVLLFGVGVASVLGEVWLQSHYTAPFTAAELILILACGRAIWYRVAASRWRGLMFLGLITICLVPLVLVYTGFLIKPRPERQQVIHELEAQGGRHLVFVRYDPDWDFHHEWVYNGARIDESRVVFAHDLGLEKDRELLAEFGGRSVWLLRAGPQLNQIELTPFTGIEPVSSGGGLPAARAIVSR